MAERTAQDIMTTPVVTVPRDASIKEVARLLSEHRISGMPVVDGENRVIGMVTEQDLLMRVTGPHLPPHIELLGGIIYLEKPHDMEEELRKAMAVTAEQIMSDEVISVEASATVREVADLMMSRKINRVPVLEEDGTLVGIITRHDVVATLVME